MMGFKEEVVTMEVVKDSLVVGSREMVVKDIGDGL